MLFSALLLSTSGARAQLSVESFPDLAPSDATTVPPSSGDDTENRDPTIAPFQIFDNLYYVGTRGVSMYVLVTDAGLVLIDSLFGEFVDDGVENIRALGFDPADIAYVFATHGHFDHSDGLAYYQQTFGARIGMAVADWKRMEADLDNREIFPVTMTMPELDMQLHDGDTLDVGDQTITFYVTPGHTEGVLSMEFTVRDGANEHRAFVFGGAGLNFAGAWRTQAYIGSVRRIQALATQTPPIEVNISNHPPGGRIFERHDALVRRTRQGRHPFVDRDGYLAYLDGLIEAAEKKLVAEYAAGN